MASAKNPMLQKTERIIQNEPVYKVLKDTGCLKKGQFIRLDAAHSRAPGVDTSALPHGHIEILRRKGEKFVEVGKCIVEDSAFVSK